MLTMSSPIIRTKEDLDLMLSDDFFSSGAWDVVFPAVFAPSADLKPPRSGCVTRVWWSCIAMQRSPLTWTSACGRHWTQQS